jgi:hypothetical protein
MNNTFNNNTIVPSQIVNIEEPEKVEFKQFDDLHYPTYRENNNFISKDNLFQMLVSDLFEYLKTIQPSNEIRVGYMLYSKLVLSSSKMNNILNLLTQQINPNIRVQSMWDTQSNFKGPMQTDKGIENVDVDKIRIKILIRPNDKEIAIKKLAEINLNHIKKNNKKINEYLVKYVH